ncbi:TPA: hypothetical protein CPT95_09025 [Candidatus Gastranaerophilales bacterium HUM_15]|jgi:hypothetical protein|nr:MAG TPA: hypothetical protein CPT88_06325 [Candidatus Gastranaerophilales bacterium HUM_8]DAB00653.1 MAG TPA: hypothetical protein CPT89_07840 [Candidatus Gastranaerophilales bacterium HUM_11]DAB07118.1 MAG TPA: hypothetical protein CPT95_09025 [Candidatus Gastranaerophilales bacterium HUM_15]DAB21543.1 MAG TPA: hypothetical protein CPT94_07550 [Candidatus Gastranaerophilales bacterium HUM_22]
MKKFLIILCLFFMMPVLADTMPFYMNSIPKNAIGMYQTGENITLYSHPEANSAVIKKLDFSYDPNTMPDNVFAVLLNEKKLGFLYVSDIGDDGWVEVIYDKITGAKGWVQTEDRFQFLPWLSFYNMYGRKYGLRILKDAPDEIETLHAKSEDLSQNVATLRFVKQIKLTVIRGNWALVSVVDIDKTPKTGYMKWRGTDGTIYAFPNIK